MIKIRLRDGYSNVHNDPCCKLTPPQTYGMDPEFGFQESTSGSARAVPAALKSPCFGAIGCDHGGTVGELRPLAGKTPEELVDNVAKLVKKLKEIIEADSSSIRAVAGGGKSDRKSYGGHLHFGWANRKEMPSGRYMRDTVVPLLDYFIGIPLQNAKGGTRGSLSYGRPGDCRPQPWGWEYRTAPSFIKHPVLAAAVLKSTKALMEFIFSHSGTLTFERDYANVADYLAIDVPQEAAYIMGGLIPYFNIAGPIDLEAWSTPKKDNFQKFLIDQLLATEGIDLDVYRKQMMMTVESRACSKSLMKPGRVYIHRINTVEDSIYREELLQFLAGISTDKPSTYYLETLDNNIDFLVKKAISQERFKCPVPLENLEVVINIIPPATGKKYKNDEFLFYSDLLNSWMDLSSLKFNYGSTVLHQVSDASTSNCCVRGLYNAHRRNLNMVLVLPHSLLVDANQCIVEIFKELRKKSFFTRDRG